MRTAITQNLTRPVHFLHSAKDKWLFIIVVNVFSPAFLIAFQPYGVNNYDPTHSLDTIFVLSMMSFGIINGFFMAVNEFLIYRLIFRHPMTMFQLIGWLVWTVFFISASTYLWYNILGGFHDWSGGGYLKFVRDVGIMGLLPLTGILLYFRNRSAKEKIESLLKFQPMHTSGDRMIFLSSDNGKDKLGVLLHQLLYIEAQDNYVAVFHLDGAGVKKSLLRNTLKNVEAFFNESPVVRCHRSYLVNLANVEKVIRNGQQLKLFLTGQSSPVSVSRSFHDTLLAYLS